jgi:hypothetical protein
MDIPTIAQTAERLTERERQRVLRELAESLGFEYHDLEQAYAHAQEGPLSLFHNNDSHWNEAGHELIADEVMSILKPDGPLASYSRPRKPPIPAACVASSAELCASRTASPP